MVLSLVLLSFAALLILLAQGRGYLAWTCCTAGLLVAWLWGGVESWTTFLVLTGVLGGLGLVFGAGGVRRALVGRPLMKIMGHVLPRMSDTEREALEAGSVWWEGELFSGRPDWARLVHFEPRALSPAERQFVDGPTEELCRRVNEWEVEQAGDLPEDVWSFIAEQRFLGMIIPQEYGGLGFSAGAHSAVVAKLSSRSVTAAVTVMVPNSLGPAELLLHYGTDEQKTHYLPRLASGEEIPCFALTGPVNGSDAAAMDAVGVVCREALPEARRDGGDESAEGRLGIRLQWDKRYTTLGPRATLIGLAFRLLDPDHLLGDSEDLGITCALVPADTQGVEIGERHDPMGIPFLNGPNRGRDVWVPLDAIIGGRAMAGQGWRMLMDCLSAGRSISLPSLSAGCMQLTTRVVGAYASVRNQFKLPIGRFEGVQERLARIAGLTYLVDAARVFTVGAVDEGGKPAVASAVMKAYATEAMRVVINDGMDVLAGAGVSRGPRNVLARAYQAVPIGITVEGANILTRSMIVFGQGAIRCHPFAQEEMAAVAAHDVERLDRAFFGHVNHIFTTAARALFAAVGLGSGGTAPVGSHVDRRLKRLTRLSTDFALAAEVAMGTLGGNLKRREMLSGRLADALAWMYMGSATLHRFVHDGQPEADRPFMEWAFEHSQFNAQEGLLGVIDNLPNRPAAWLLRLAAFPLGARARPPRDRVSRAAAEALLDGGEGRERLTGAIFVPADDDPGLGQLEDALRRVVAARGVRSLLRGAVKSGKLAQEPRESLYERAVSNHVLTAEQRRVLEVADGARERAVAVDAFPGDALGARRA